MENIKVYYESLRQIYEQMVEREGRKPPFATRILGWLTAIAGLGLFLTLVPVLPLILAIFGNMFGFNQLPLGLDPRSLSGFGLMWLLGFGFFLAALLALMNLESNLRTRWRERNKNVQTLSREQLTFVALYKAQEELKAFFVSHIHQHVTNSLRALSPLMPYWDKERIESISMRGEIESRRMSRPDDIQGFSFPPMQTYYAYNPTPNFPEQILIAQEFLDKFENYNWLSLDTPTLDIFHALVDFKDKIPSRLHDRKDLSTILSILENLTKFVYAYLPEHRVNSSPASLAQLREEGSACLREYTKEIDGLTRYFPDSIDQSKTRTPKTNLVRRIQEIYSKSIFARFTLWFLLILILTSSAVFLFTVYVKLTADTMASVVITTSVLGAAGLAALPTNSKAE